MMPSAIAQEKGEVMPFGYNSPREPALAPDAPPTTYWNIDDVRKAHTELAQKAARAATGAVTGAMANTASTVRASVNAARSGFSDSYDQSRRDNERKE